MTDRLIVWHRWLPPREERETELEALLAWRRAVAGRLRAAGGTVLGSLGASVAGLFDPGEAVDVIEVCLDLLDEAEREAGLDVSIGVAIGRTLDDEEDGPVGEALERAQLLANRARGGELVLDITTRDRVSDELLFLRQVGAGAGASRGTTVDRSHPRREDCARSIAALGAPRLPPALATLRDEIGQLLDRGAARSFVLRGPVGAGASELVASLAEARGGRVWRLGASPGGIVPLASLRSSYLRGLEHDPSFAARSGPALKVLERVAAGELVQREALSAALASLVHTENAAGRRPWVVLSPLGLVDGASLRALLGARESGADFVLVGRQAVESGLPRPLDELDEPVHQLVLPPLKMSDALVVAEAVLGADTASDVVRRIAVLAGDTVLGVLEAARTLVASGELVHDGEGFRWRTGPRSGAQGIGTEEILSERLEHLDGPTRSVLEALAVMPDGSSRALLEDAAELDGVPRGRSFARCLEVLAREALARGVERPRPASILLRWQVLSLVPAARSKELHRFAGEALSRRGGETVPRQVELGYYLIEGGLEERGRPILRDALESIVSAGYARAASLISGWMAVMDERAAARSIGPRSTPAPSTTFSHEDGPPSSELRLDELLEEAAVSAASSLLPAPTPAVFVPALDREAFDGEEDTLVPASSMTGIEPGTPPDPVPLALVADDTTQDRPAPPEQPREAPLALDGDAPLGVPLPPPSGMAPLEGETTDVGPAPARPFVEEAVRALRARDFDGLERALDRAVVGGGDLGAVERVRALAELVRGDLAGARQSLADARARGRDDGASRARHHLAMALLELNGGHPLVGVRASLAALATSRRDGDARGQGAALRALAACYRALGRGELAERVDPDCG